MQRRSPMPEFRTRRPLFRLISCLVGVVPAWTPFGLYSGSYDVGSIVLALPPGDFEIAESPAVAGSVLNRTSKIAPDLGSEGVFSVYVGFGSVDATAFMGHEITITAREIGRRGGP